MRRSDQSPPAHSSSPQRAPARPPVRWWPAWLVLLAAAVAWGWLVALANDVEGQTLFARKITLAVLTVVALLLWLLAASRLAWRVRVAVLAGVLVVVGAASQLVEIRGVDGDVVPIFAWRWTPRPAPPRDLPQDLQSHGAVAAAASIGAPAAGLAGGSSAGSEAPASASAAPGAEVADAAPVADPESAAPTGTGAALAEVRAAAAGQAVDAAAGTSTAAPVADPSLAMVAAAPAPRAETTAALPGAGDYPQFLGPRRDGTVPGLALARDWKAKPPRELWRRPIGAGWSAFAVAGDLAVTQEQDGKAERITAYDLATGTPRWSSSSPGRYATTIAGEGPRATPTIDGGLVFAVGATGTVSALDLASGTLRWQRDLGADTAAVTPEWGRSTSPLVVGELVIVNAGGPAGKSLVAYDRTTGEPRWMGGDDGPSYSSPVLATLGGVAQVVVFGQGELAGHDLATGAVLWRHPVSRQQPNVALPLILANDLVLYSAGYGVGSELLAVAPGADGAWAVTSRWQSPRLKSKFANPVLYDGRIWGLDDGTLACLDPTTGERCWREGRYGHGQVTLVGDLLLVTAETGEIALVEPSPTGARELGRFRAFASKSWNPPAVAGRYLVVRNDREAACYELPLAD